MLSVKWAQSLNSVLKWMQRRETHKYILQRNESNLGFLKRLAARNNCQLRVEPGKLLFKKADGGGYGYTLNTNTGLISLNMSYNSSDMVQNVVVRSWDIMTKKEIVGKASASDIQNIGSGQAGAQAAGVFGEIKPHTSQTFLSPHKRWQMNWQKPKWNE